PMGQLVGADILFSPLQFVLPGPLDITLGALLVLLLGLVVWTLTRSEIPQRRSLPLQVWGPALALIFPVGLWLMRRSAADGLLASRAAGGFAVQLASALLIGLAIFVVLRHARVPRLPSRYTSIARFA